VRTIFLLLLAVATATSASAESRNDSLGTGLILGGIIGYAVGSSNEGKAAPTVRQFAPAAGSVYWVLPRVSERIAEPFKARSIGSHCDRPERNVTSVETHFRRALGRATYTEHGEQIRNDWSGKPIAGRLDPQKFTILQIERLVVHGNPPCFGYLFWFIENELVTPMPPE
jgi:hypothetical protein